MHAYQYSPSFSRGTKVLAIVVTGATIAMAGMLSTAQPAAAQQGFGNFFGYETKKRPKKRYQRPAKRQTPVEKEVANAPEPTDPVYVVISIGDQRISVYDANGRIAQSRVSTGKAGHRTPSGVFSVISKRRHHYSNLYGGAPMPWMQRITWSGVAMHAGHVPGYPASHGCIRLPYSFAPRLWKMTKMGARVVVAPRDTVPFDIAHDFFPAPKMHTAPGADTSAQQAAAPGGARIELASMGSDVNATMAAAAAADPANEAGPKLLDPMAYATALKAYAKEQKRAADKLAKDRLAIAQAAGKEARQAEDDVREGEVDLSKAEERLAKAEDSLASAQAKMSEAEADYMAAEAIAAKLTATVVPLPVPSDASKKETAKLEKVTEDVEREAEKAQRTAERAKKSFMATQERVDAAATSKTAALSALAKARGALDEAKRREAINTPRAFDAVQSWKQAVAAGKAAAKALDEAERRTEPVSVFISAKEGRIFIRQDWKEVYEAPVTIRDPDRPLGTHVYMAVATQPDGSAMRWSAISVPESGTSKSKKSSKSKDDAKTAEDDAKPETAAGALDRIEIPEAARQRISELLWTGASLIVSDKPRSHEMGEYTDFIVLTR